MIKAPKSYSKIFKIYKEEFDFRNRSIYILGLFFDNPDINMTLLI